MATKLETLQEKLSKLQSDIQAEQQKETVEAAIAETRDTFSAAILAAIAIVEKDTGKTLREISLGIWIAYPKADDSTLTVSALLVGEDGLPAALKRSINGHSSNGHSNGNGNGYTFKLADGRTFDSCEKAVNALGVKTRNADNDFLEGKQYYYRHDRLPKELKEKIEKVATETPAGEQPETPAGEQPETPAGE